jgi:ABC-type polysaccharide/polyol phosphate transport system ATPase subunit
VSSSDRNLSTALGAPSKPRSGSPALASPEPSAAEIEIPAGTDAITAQEISKTFRITHRPATLKETVLHPFRRNPVEILDALKDVSFEVAKGEFFGIIGANGSGKSTLLKIIAGIYRPNAGQIRVEGRLSPFIELGVGFNPELAARDNVVINCALLGLTRREALRRFDRIIEFAELERFVDMKLKNYSSGMQVRLAFSTAIQVDADILLLDEVLAVGDASFQEKCFETFRLMQEEGRTIVLVTHNLEIVERFCDRAMLIDSGEQLTVDEPAAVLKAYRSEMRPSSLRRAGEERPHGGRPGEGSAEVLDAWIEDSSGRRVETCRQGEPIRVCARVAFHNPMRKPEFAFGLRNERGEEVISASTGWDGIETRDFEPGEHGRIALALDNVLSVGRYTIGASVAYQYGTTVADVHQGIGSFQVDGERWTPGAVDVPHEFEVELEK